MLGFRRTKGTDTPNTTKEHPIEILLATLCVFSDLGRDEVSLSEFQESISEFQKEYPSLGYSFSEIFLLSSDLLSDLKIMEYQALIRNYRYTLDSLLPKHFLALTALGRGIGRRKLEGLDVDSKNKLNVAVKMAIENYNERWRLWSRPTT